MSLQSRFFQLIEHAQLSHSMCQDLLASGDPQGAQDELNAMRGYKAQAILLVRNSQALADLIGWQEEDESNALPN